MPPKFAVGFRATCVAVALIVATAHAADPKPAIVGATRDQVIARYGEPRSQMTAGRQEILFYPHERLVLKNGVVVEVEMLSMEPSSRRVPSRDSNPPDNGANVVSVQSAPVPGDAAGQKNQSQPPASAFGGEQRAGSGTDGPLEIKSIRPRGAPSATPSIAVTVPVVAPVEVKPVVVEPVKISPPVVVAVKPEKIAPAKPVVAPKPRPKPVAQRKLMTADLSMPSDEPIVTVGTYGFALLGLVAGGIYFKRRRSQRVSGREVKRVAVMPVAAPTQTEAVKSTAFMFTVETLERLEWSRLEELVAAYYSRTGVIVARTMAGPQGAVHIKISWKGESRPFAAVQCVTHPSGLISPKPLEELLATLATENIRRGYVITGGKFSAQAREFAADKHLTLLPGEVFCEKLNSLPEAARAELQQQLKPAEGAVLAAK